jgi:hypothetical protein
MSVLSDLMSKLKGGESEEEENEVEEEVPEDHSPEDHDSEEEEEACQFC